MPTLDEYLGGIVHSIATARRMADIQAVDTAEKYVKHDLLQHFSVPRMRIADVEVTIPLAMDRLSAEHRSELQPTKGEALKPLIVAEIAAALGMKEATAELQRACEPLVTDGINNLTKNVESLGVKSAIEIFANTIRSGIPIVTRQLKLKLPNRAAEIQADVIRRVSNTTAQNVRGFVKQPLPSSVEVIGEAHRLLEQRPENLVRVKMTIREEGMEWHFMEDSQGATTRKLLPE